MNIKEQPQEFPAIGSSKRIRAVHPSYRADIDGLRAIAVLSVVIFHAFPSALRGGFIGVDIFFVISGYLISTIIVGNLENHTFSFADFYGRRVRRIFPVLIMVMVASQVAGWYLMLADEYKQLGAHVTGGAGFLSNFLFWHESGYFDSTAETKPLLHLWSLGVEEQFYILWPALMWWSWKKRFNLLSVTILVGLISLSLNVSVVHTDPAKAFYSPQTRFWEMTCGSILAWLSLHGKSISGRVRNRVNTLLSLAIFAVPRPKDGRVLSDVQSLLGILLIILGFWLVTKNSVFPGWWAMLPIAGALLLISAGGQALFNRVVLSHPAVVWVGLVSFPLYLWHWPLLAFARLAERDTPAPEIRVAALAAALTLAWLSYVFVEKPMRSGKNNRIKTTVLVVLIVSVAACGYFVHRHNGFPSRMADRQAFSAYFENDLPTWHYFTRVGIPDKVSHDCEFFDIASYRSGHNTGIPRPSIAPHCYQRDLAKPHVVMLWGDSHAEHLSYGIKKNLPPDWQLLQVATSACAASLNMEPSATDQCVQSNWFAQKLVTETKPDVVVIAQSIGHTAEKFEQFKSKLTSLGVKKIIFAGPVPHWTASLPSLMLTKFWVDTPRHTYRGVDMSIVDSNTKLSSGFKPTESAVYADITAFLCDKKGCLTYLGDDRAAGITTYDESHLTPTASDYVAKNLLVPLITRPKTP